MLACLRREGVVYDLDVEDSGVQAGGAPVLSERVECADPVARDAQGPLERVAVFGEQKSGMIHPSAGSGLAVADMDGDGRLDLLLPQGGRDQLLLQAEDGSFEDVTATHWPNRTVTTSTLSVVDIDADGDMDVYACHEAAANTLYVNDGSGHLEDVSAEWGVDAHSRNCFGASFGDLDGDGDLDMALANNDPCMSGNNGQDCSEIKELASSLVLWENVGGRFEDISDRLPHEQLLGSMMSNIVLIDIDGDVDLDIVVANDVRMEISFSEDNLAFINDGQGNFTDISADSGLGISIESMGVGIGDLNGDARPDFLISGTRQLAILVSSASWWYDADAALGLVPIEESRWFAWGNALADLDNDGDLDAPVTYGWLPPTEEAENPLLQADALFINEDGTFTESADAWGWADTGYGRGVAVIDVNGDGWLDILKRELGDVLVVDRARCGDASWVTVGLQQDGPNPTAIGAQVTIEAGDQQWKRWVLAGGTSYAVNLPPRVHVGLGGLDRIDRVLVTWPDGQTEAFEGGDTRHHWTLIRTP